MASAIRHQVHPVKSCYRTFSTTSRRVASLQWKSNDPELLASVVPAYPYGPTRWYKQSQRGLYGGQSIRFGNNVSEEFELKTRRSWHPNIKTKKLYSVALKRTVQIRVSTRVLRTIDKLGGLDEYLLGEKEARIKELGESGWWLRWAIMQTPEIKRRFAMERAALGLSAQDSESIAMQSIPEEVEAEAAKEAVEEGEVLSDDGSIVAEADEGVPALRWRVGPNQSLVLTDKGWRRVHSKAPDAHIKHRVLKHLRFHPVTKRALRASKLSPDLWPIQERYNSKLESISSAAPSAGSPVESEGEQPGELKVIDRSQRKGALAADIKMLQEALVEDLTAAAFEEVRLKKQKRYLDKRPDLRDEQLHSEAL